MGPRWGRGARPAMHLSWLPGQGRMDRKASRVSPTAGHQACPALWLLFVKNAWLLYGWTQVLPLGGGTLCPEYREWDADQKASAPASWGAIPGPPMPCNGLDGPDPHLAWAHASDSLWSDDMGPPSPSCYPSSRTAGRCWEVMRQEQSTKTLCPCSVTKIHLRRVCSPTLSSVNQMVFSHHVTTVSPSAIAHPAGLGGSWLYHVPRAGWLGPPLVLSQSMHLPRG